MLGDALVAHVAADASDGAREHADLATKLYYRLLVAFLESEEKRLKQHLLKRRMSYGEMLVEAQRSAKAAADKAARSVAIAKTRQNKPERDTIQPKKAKASKPKTNRKAKAPEVQPAVSQESVRPPSKGRSSIGLRI